MTARDRVEFIREFTTELVLDHAREIEFLSVCELLAEDNFTQGMPVEEVEKLAREIHDLALEATVTVELAGSTEPAGREQGESPVDDRTPWMRLSDELGQWIATLPSCARRDAFADVRSEMDRIERETGGGS